MTQSSRARNCCPMYKKASEELIASRKAILNIRNAGTLFDQLLSAVGLDRKTDCFITNITHCRPPQNRTPTPEEARNCSYVLLSEISIVQPDIIFAVGGVAAEFMLGRKIYITKDNGSINEVPWIQQLSMKPTVVVPMIHPAYVLRKIGSADEMEVKLAIGEGVRKGLRHIKFPGLRERPVPAPK